MVGAAGLVVDVDVEIEGAVGIDVVGTADVVVVDVLDSTTTVVDVEGVPTTSTFDLSGEARTAEKTGMATTATAAAASIPRPTRWRQRSRRPRR